MMARCRTSRSWHVQALLRSASRSRPLRLAINKSAEKTGAELRLAWFRDGRILTPAQRVQAGGADEKADAADGAEDHGQTEVSVGGLQL